MEDPVKPQQGGNARRNRAGAEQQDDEEKIKLDRLVSMFEDAEEATDDARKLAERDRDYRDNIQLTTEEKQKLKDRNQPDTIFNLIGPKIDYLVGFEASNRTDPRAFPRTPADEDAAEAATDGLRYLKDANDLDEVFSADWENMLVDGFCGHELVVTPGQDDSKIEVKHWAWDRLFYDPHSRRHDFEDATYKGGIIWMDVEAAKRKWPDAEEALERTVSDATLSQTYEDRPHWKTWCQGKNRKRVRIVQMYYLEGDTWHWCIFTRGGKIDGGEVPFRDEDGKSWCPLLMESAYVNRENERYGLVRGLIGAQDGINKRHSKALHLLSVRQTLGERGAVDDTDLMKAELAKPDGHVEINPGFRFELLDTTQQLQGHVLLLEKHEQMIERLGPNAALLGKDANAPSGRAILANQAGGQLELGALLDRLRFLKKRTYQRLWDLIRQYKTAEWWVRVTDDDKNVKFVGFNRPVTMGEKLVQQLQENGADEQAIQAHLAQMQMDPAQAVGLQQVVDIENVPARMNMDITIEEVPDVANVQSEQFEQLVNLASAGVKFPPKVYIKASSLRDKKELMDELEAAQNDPQQQAVQMATIQGQLEKMAAEIAKLKSETIKNLAQADQADAQTGVIQTPQVLPPGSKPNGDGASQRQPESSPA
jgi:hypothetical protein